MANKDRSNYEPPPKPGGEGWLYSEQQQKLCHFKPSMATVHAQWVRCAPSAGATTATSADDPAADASAQRDRSLDNDAENRVGALQATGAVISRSSRLVARGPLLPR